MFEVKLYSNFSKRINSTKQPGNITALSKMGDLRAPCSVEKPVIAFKNMGASAPVAYSYAYIAKFNRYYFISDWVYVSGFWECHLTEDYLASWKTNIGATNAYIDRCASAYNGNIIDTKYTTKTDYQITNTAIGWTLNQTGCYVVGIVGGTAVSTQIGGSITYYVLTREQCTAMMNYLMSTAFLNNNGFNTIASTTQQLTQETAKAFVNPFQFIVSCMWLPLDPILLYPANTPDSQISVGYWLIDANIATGKKLNAVYVPIAYTVALPVHPQANTRGEYLNYAPYTRLAMYIPPFGTIPIDPMYRRLGNYLRGRAYIDPITGTGELHCFITQTQSEEIDTHTGTIVASATAQLGVPIQLAQVSNNFINALSEGVQAVASIDVAGAIGGVTSMMASGAGMGSIFGALKGITPETVSHVGNAVMSLQPQVRTSGSNGSSMWAFLYPRIWGEFSLLVDEDNTEMGRPLREKRVINTLSGYVKCFEVTVDYPCYDTEKDVILNYLLSGFFWE